MTPTLKARVAILLPIALCGALSLGAAVAGSAATQPTPPEAGAPPAGKPDRRPPPEALAACKGKAEGNACSMTLPDGKTMRSVCHAEGDDRTLACAPTGPAPRN